MKNNKLYIGLAGIAIAMTLPSCESDYLQLTPETSVSSGTMAEETIAAKMGIYGICNAMQTQYYETGYNQYSGEAFINTVFNDAFGPDYICSLWQSSWGASQYNWEAMENERGTINSYPWNYCYNIIGLANGVLDGVDNGNGSQAEKDFIKAQALTFRAHGYEKLLRWYAPRWKDSKNGEAYCVVLRLTSGTNDLPIVTMNQVLDQIYADLDEAIKLYTSSKGKRTYKWEPDIAVAQGVYARTALIKNDWKKAQEMAHAARENYPVADLKTYFAGFVNDTNDN
ncbi:MAG: RagB/SusD family nutrient uptake outer membrane protein, partial [Muribaculaceae bacterium]|nr:RagB/SusD family nutrient uptake outer membrane protein [Muribaculaceae bacterium]